MAILDTIKNFKKKSDAGVSQTLNNFSNVKPPSQNMSVAPKPVTIPPAPQSSAKQSFIPAAPQTNAIPPAPQSSAIMSRERTSPPQIPAVPAPVTPQQTSRPSPIFRGENNQLFFRGKNGFEKIRNAEGPNSHLQQLARDGRIEVGGQYQNLPSGALGGTPSPVAPQQASPSVSSPQPVQAPSQGSQGQQASTGVDPLTAQREALRQDLLRSQLPTDEENSIQDQITTLLSRGDITYAQAQEAAAEVMKGGKNVTLDIATGQQGALMNAGLAARNTAAQEAMPLEQRLANLIAQRGQAQNAANTQLGFANEDLTAQRTADAGLSSQLEAMALIAKQGGASQEEIAQIMGAGSYENALGAAGKYLQQSSGSKVLSVADAKSLGVPYGTTEAEAAAKNITPQEHQDMINGMTDQQVSIMQNIQGQVKGDPDIKGFIDIRDANNRIESALGSMKEDGTLTPAADMSLIFNYMKMLDPGSTVREGEFANAQNTTGIPGAVLNLYNKAKEGNRLNATQIQEFAQQANSLYDAKLANHQDAIEFYTNQADSFGIPTELILRDFAGSGTGGDSGGGSTVQPLIKSYASLDSLFQDRPEYVDIVGQMASETGMSDQEILKLLEQQGSGGGSTGLFTDDLSRSVNDSVGQLSEKYESGGDPGAIGYDSTGGYSYGAYQLAHNNADRFVTQSKYASEFKGIPFNSKDFQSKWKEIAQRDPEGFKAEQKNYIAKTHYDPQLKKIASETGLNVDRLSPAIKDVIWSTAVQHGGNTDIIVNAIKSSNKTTSEEELINKIYDLRWSGGQQFISSTAQVKKSVKNRFDNEKKQALSQLRMA